MYSKYHFKRKSSAKIRSLKPKLNAHLSYIGLHLMMEAVCNVKYKNILVSDLQNCNKKHPLCVWQVYTDTIFPHDNDS